MGDKRDLSQQLPTHYTNNCCLTRADFLVLAAGTEMVKQASDGKIMTKFAKDWEPLNCT